MPFLALVPLLTTLLPVLVSTAEKIIPGSNQGEAKRAWVMAALKDMEPFLVRLEPQWLQGSNPLIEQLLDVIIELALDKAGL